MATFNEILTARGLENTAITGILDDLKANGLFLTSHENMDIRYPKLKGDFEGQGKQLKEALATIETLQKATKGHEEAQKEINEHKARNEALIAEILQMKIDAAARYGLLAAGAEDVDYMLFVLKEDAKAENKPLELDETGNSIKGWDDRLKDLQTKKPKMFKAEGGDDSGYQVFEPNKFKKGDDGQLAVTKERFKDMSYEERVALKQKNETLYKQLAKN